MTAFVPQQMAELNSDSGYYMVHKGQNIHYLSLQRKSLPMPALCVRAQSLSHVQLCATPRTVARQAPVSMGILQARTLEWVALTASGRSSQPRGWTHFSCIGRWILYLWATPVLLPGESQGQECLGGCCFWGRTESDTTEVMQQQQQHAPTEPNRSRICHNVL